MRCDEYQQKRYSDVFGKEAKRYHMLNSSKIKKAVSFFESHKGGKILDIGCGDGVFSKTIEEQTGAKMFGLDISESCIKNANVRGIDAKCMNIDGSKLPFKDSVFDAVFCGDTIEHIFDTEKLVKEIHRTLKPCGYLVITMPNVNAWYNRILVPFGYLPAWVEPTTGNYKGTPFFEMGCGHIRAFNKRVIKHFLEERGFKIEILKGAPIVADDDMSDRRRRAWNFADSFFAKFAGLSTFIIIKARKAK